LTRSSAAPRLRRKQRNSRRALNHRRKYREGDGGTRGGGMPMMGNIANSTLGVPPPVDAPCLRTHLPDVTRAREASAERDKVTALKRRGGALVFCPFLWGLVAANSGPPPTHSSVYHVINTSASRIMVATVWSCAELEWSGVQHHAAPPTSIVSATQPTTPLTPHLHPPPTASGTSVRQMR
jgi:hypothetical protein